MNAEVGLLMVKNRILLRALDDIVNRCHDQIVIEIAQNAKDITDDEDDSLVIHLLEMAELGEIK